MRKRTDMVWHLARRLRGIGIAGVATGGLLVDAAHRPAAAASAQSVADPGDFVYEMEWYLHQVMEWIRVGIDSTVRAYHLDASQLYKLVLTLFVLAIFVCLMVKAFMLGKQAAERVSRNQ